jgi:DNA polymerase III epsilon subunit-like protein
VIAYSDNLTRIRVLDLETTGISPDDAIIEIAAVDLIGPYIVIVGSDLVRSPVPIPPQASAVHHITDADVLHCPALEDRLPYYLDASGEDGVDIFASHNWRFESQWIGGELRGRPAICTYKCALRAWPEAPAHNNQTLLEAPGLAPGIRRRYLRRIAGGRAGATPRRLPGGSDHRRQEAEELVVRRRPLGRVAQGRGP